MEARALRAGTPMLAIDTPPPALATTNVTNNDLGGGEFISWSPETGTLFRAPTSGVVLLIVGGGLSSDGDQVAMAPEVRLGQVVGSGEVVEVPTVADNSWSSTQQSENNVHQYGCRAVPLTDLVPGQVYSVRLMMFGESGGTGDVDNGQVIVLGVG